MLRKLFKWFRKPCTLHRVPTIDAALITEFIHRRGRIIANDHSNIDLALSKLGVDAWFAGDILMIAGNLGHGIHANGPLMPELLNRLHFCIDEQFGFLPPARIVKLRLRALAYRKLWNDVNAISN